METSQPKLIPVTQWNKHHTWPPIGGLRHLIFHEKTNGFDQVVRRAGRRVLLDEDAFFAWIEKQNPSAMAEKNGHGVSKGGDHG
jgi:hypothetical protein